MKIDRFQIPSFVSMSSIIEAAAEDLEPAEAVTAAEAAERHMWVKDTRTNEYVPLTFDRAPFSRRPLEAFSSGLYRLVVVQGPSQTAKSTIIMGAMSWSVKYEPAPWVCLFPDQVISGKFSATKWEPTVQASPDLKGRIREVPNAWTTWRQQFRGMDTEFIWPVPSQLRFRTCRFFVADDFDAIPEDIGGEGDPVTLLFGRTPAYDGKECGILASSPALGHGKGIAAHVAKGTEERLHSKCPHCAEFFELNLIEQLKFDTDGSPADAAESVYVLCPNNGCVIKPEHKMTLARNAVWVGAGQTILRDGTITGELRRTSTASFLIDGLVGFLGWPRLAELWREAEMEWESRQSETRLATFYNTRAGVNYTTRREVLKPLEADDLSALKVEGQMLGFVPDWAVCITASVDVQGNRFPVQFTAWGRDGRSAIIDRFDIREWREGPVQPHRDAEVWDVLTERVFDHVVPIAGNEGQGFRAAAVAIDSQGLDGVTKHARMYARRLRARGVPDWRVMLTHGAKQITAPEIGTIRWEMDDQGKRLPDAVPIFSIGVNELKSQIDTQLRFTDGGANSISLPWDFSAEHLAELTAEHVVDGRWTKKAEKIANETLDLTVGNKAAHMRLRVDRVDWSDPPDWAKPVSISAVAPVEHAPRGRRVRSHGIG